MNPHNLEVACEDGLMIVTLDRPERLNALDEALVDALRLLFEGLRERDDVRVVILKGNGRVFCAGADMRQTFDMDQAVSSVLQRQRRITDVILAMRRCPQPIIALIHGPATGGGFGLALASDVRLATAEARFSAFFVRIGLTGCDVGVSYFLPRMIGASRASEYMLTGRFIDAETALAMGLVSRILPAELLMDEARALAADMLRASPLGLRLTKETITHSLDASSLASVIAMEDRTQVLCTRDPGHQEAMAAFFEKRAPRFT